MNLKTHVHTRGEDGTVAWEESFKFKVPIGPDLRPLPASLALYRHHGLAIANDERLAVADDLDLDAENSVELQDESSEEKIFGSLIVRVHLCLPEIDGFGMSMPLQRIGITEKSHAWQTFVPAFQKAIAVANNFDKLDPAAQVALGAVSFVLEAVKKQMERDERVNDLEEMMTSLLLFFQDIEKLQRSPFLQDILGRLLRQVSECSYFVFQYQEIESFTERAAVHLTSDTDAVLDRFYNVFTGIRADLALGTSLQTMINTEYILNKVTDIDAVLHVNRLRYLEGSTWRTDKQCPEATHDFTINRIHRWISSFEPGLFVLTGPEGSGQSGILHRLAIALSETGRLGACVFLNEHTRGEKTADSVMWTLIYHLANSNATLGRKIALGIAQQPMLVSADAAYYARFFKLFADDLVLYGPLVIIVDGLHTLNNPHDQELLYSLLGQAGISSHHKLRFIVSRRSTPFPDYGHVYWPINHPVQVSSDVRWDTLFQNACGDRPNDGQPGVDHSSDSSTELIRQCSMGSLRWLDMAYGMLVVFPEAVKPFLDGVRLYSRAPTSEEDALYLLCLITLHTFRYTVLDYDFFRATPGARLFIQSRNLSTNPKALHPADDPSRRSLPFSSPCFQVCDRELHHDQLTLFTTAGQSRVEGFDEYAITGNGFSSVSAVFTAYNPLLLPIIDSKHPLNIYRIHIREASASENRGPVYARFALPASKPLLDGRNIREQLEPYGIYGFWLDQMASKSPPEGCEWIILHRGLFPLEKHDGYTSVIATTPVLTPAILERLTCIFVTWADRGPTDTCLLRRGMEVPAAGFLKMNSFTEVHYSTHEAHAEPSAELVCGEEKKGCLRSGDRIQVKGTWPDEEPWAVIALAVKYDPEVQEADAPAAESEESSVIDDVPVSLFRRKTV